MSHDVSALSHLKQRPQLAAALLSAVIALVAISAALATLDPAGAGPGVTVDEFYDAAAGKRLVHAWQTEGWAFFARDRIEKNFDPLTRHPPLGRWLLGWTHALLDPDPQQPESVQLVAARVAPVLAYGVLIFCVGCYAGRQLGPVGAAVAAWAVAIIPNLFGHAHFATLDTFTALFAFLTIQSLVGALEAHRWWRFALAGVVWGMALLTKYHGLILIAPVTVVLFGTLGWRAWKPWLIWCVTAGVVFYAGWPWLWLAPVAHLREYLSSATQRAPLHVFYWGHVWNDVVVPWHYPWVMLLVTLPTGLLLLAGIGVWVQRAELVRNPRWALPALGSLAYLVVFSWPGVPVYDGVRLFLAVYAWIALFVAAGAVALYHKLASQLHAPRIAAGALAIFLLLQAYPVVAYRPFWLSHYNLALGGLRGAERLGFEVTYWGDTVTHDLLDPLARAIPGQQAIYLPNLAPFHATAVAIASPALSDAGVSLVGVDQYEAGGRAAGLVVFHRRADLPDLATRFPGAELIAETTHRGVWLARAFRLSVPMSKGAVEPVEK